MVLFRDASGMKIALKLNEGDIREGLTFFTEDDDFLQVGSWKYAMGKKLPAHNHNRVERLSERTQELVYVLRGRMKASIYDESDRLLQECILATGDFLVCFSGGHGYEILEDDTIVLEVKNGPYVGAALDRRRLGAGE